MFRFFKIDEFLDLKCKHCSKWLQWEDISTIRLKYPEFKWFEELQWGLKHAGTLICVDHIERYRPKKVLEVGAGFNIYFDRNYGAELDYWMIDDIGFYGGDILSNANHLRKNTTFIDGLLGKGKNCLPKNYFDMIFSISVLEHIPESDIHSFCDEMYKLVTKNGFIVHTIDLEPSRAQTHGKLWYDALVKAGFKFEEIIDLRWEVSGSKKNQPLTEPLSIVYQYYGGFDENQWKQKRKFNNYFYGSIIAVGKKTKYSFLSKF